MSQPRLSDVLAALAEHHGVCVRPVALRRTDTFTGQTEIVEVPCGATLASKCKPCAERGRRLRIQQFREGWHLADEPTEPVEKPTEEVTALVGLRCQYAFDRDQAQRAGAWEQVQDLDRGIDRLDEYLATLRVRGSLPHPATPKQPRRIRSTRRRSDATELPRLPVENRTVGRTYAGRHGRTYRPSTLLTVTLPGYGEVHTGPRTRRGYLQPCTCGQLHPQTDPLLGTPTDPASYDYRTAALDAVFFAATLDRLWQNLRRAAGWKVQYAGAVELQKRGAPHAHFAVRGTLPRTLLRQIAAGTYHQVWWPQFDHAAYTVDAPPRWDAAQNVYVDPKTSKPLTTWAAALDALGALGEDAAPAYVARLGRIDARGINAGSKDADRSIRYVTKYVTKDLAEHVDPRSEQQRTHFDRLHAALSVVPCSPSCANWLLYGVQPDKAKPGLVPGRCRGKVHQRRTLAFTGRRVLVSRHWSSKTLADHRADNRAWVRHVLAGALSTDELADQPAAADQTGPAERSRYSYEIAKTGDPDVPDLRERIMRAIAIRDNWRHALRTATAPPGDGNGAVPATQDQQPAAHAA